MALTVFDHGLDEIDDIVALTSNGTLRALLIKDVSYAPAASAQFVSTTSGSEVTTTSYSRATFTSGTRTVDTTNHRVRFDANNPSFSTPAAGQTAYGMVVYRFVSADSDSPMIAWYPFASPTALDGNAFTVTLNSSGLIQYVQG